MVAASITDIRVQGMKTVEIKRFKIGVSFYFKGETVLQSFALIRISVFHRLTGAFAVKSGDLFKGGLCDVSGAKRLASLFIKAVRFFAPAFLNKKDAPPVHSFVKPTSVRGV